MVLWKIDVIIHVRLKQLLLKVKRKQVRSSKKLISLGISSENISQATGLSEEEINKLTHKSAFDLYPTCLTTSWIFYLIIN